MAHGRFQPFHNGHLEYCLEAGARCERLVVGLTNPGPSRIAAEPDDPGRSEPDSNPFPYHVRARMVQLAVFEAGIDPCALQIVPFPIHHKDLWRWYVPPSAVQFLRIQSAWDGRKAERFSAAGYPVVDLAAGRSKNVSGTQVRERWRDGGDWRSLVPPAVARIMETEAHAGT